jgi:hypothetical protein
MSLTMFIAFRVTRCKRPASFLAVYPYVLYVFHMQICIVEVLQICRGMLVCVRIYLSCQNSLPFPRFVELVISLRHNARSEPLNKWLDVQIPHLPLARYSGLSSAPRETLFSCKTIHVLADPSLSFRIRFFCTCENQPCGITKLCVAVQIMILVQGPGGKPALWPGRWPSRSIHNELVHKPIPSHSQANGECQRDPKP